LLIGFPELCRPALRGAAGLAFKLTNVCLRLPGRLPILSLNSDGPRDGHKTRPPKGWDIPGVVRIQGGVTTETFSKDRVSRVPLGRSDKCSSEHYSAEPGRACRIMPSRAEQNGKAVGFVLGCRCSAVPSRAGHNSVMLRRAEPCQVGSLARFLMQGWDIPGVVRNRRGETTETFE
jgi:hypothetical protein